MSETVHDTGDAPVLPIAINPDDLAALEEQRAFLLQSLRDLEHEHESGDIDETDYRTLKDDYTARAAAVLRAIEAGKASLAAPRRRRPWRTALVVVAILLGGALAGELLARFSGERVNNGASSSSSSAASAKPGGDLGKALSLFQAGKPLDAVKLLDAYLKKHPKDAEAMAYRGWIIRLAGREGNSAELLAAGEKAVDQALKVDRNNLDAHFFKGMILFQDHNDPAKAIPEFEIFLAGNPPEGMVPMVEGQLKAARDALTRAKSAPSTTVGAGSGASSSVGEKR